MQNITTTTMREMHLWDIHPTAQELTQQAQFIRECRKGGAYRDPDDLLDNYALAELTGLTLKRITQWRSGRYLIPQATIICEKRPYWRLGDVAAYYRAHDCPSGYDGQHD